MKRSISIEPVTRIEGHAKISISLDDSGRVSDAKFHVTEFRGFEKFCIGRSFWEMPSITARICGICPVSHSLASAKAGDAILGVTIPPAAVNLRRLLNWAQIVQSHALSFFHLSGPDLLLGMESSPEKRNIFGLMEAKPDIVRKGIRLRKFGQDVIRLLGDRSVHPAWAVPGGVRDPLNEQTRAVIKESIPEALAIAHEAVGWGQEALERHADTIPFTGDFPSMHMGLVGETGSLEHYDGVLSLMDADGNLVEKNIEPSSYASVLGEGEESWTYLKFPYYKPRGLEGGAGMYRVGPLARLNVADFAGTPGADRELRRFRQFGKGGKPVSASFHYHTARLIEILHAMEMIERIIDDPEITSDHVRAQAGVNQRHGVGVVEAPRGTLFHDYEVDADGLLTRINLLIATGQNNFAMNQTIRQIADEYLRGDKLDEGLLNRVEHGIRVFDPCLSCATHDAGRMPLDIELLDPEGNLLDRAMRARR